MPDPNTRPEPHDVSFVWLPVNDRPRGWYEDRKPQGLLHERVMADMVGVRTYVVDGIVISEAVVLPDGKGVSYGFVRFSNFVITQRNRNPHIPAPDEIGSVDRPL